MAVGMHQYNSPWNFGKTVSDSIHRERDRNQRRIEAEALNEYRQSQLGMQGRRLDIAEQHLDWQRQDVEQREIDKDTLRIHYGYRQPAIQENIKERNQALKDAEHWMRPDDKVGLIDTPHWLGLKLLDLIPGISGLSQTEKQRKAQIMEEYPGVSSIPKTTRNQVSPTILHGLMNESYPGLDENQTLKEGAGIK